MKKEFVPYEISLALKELGFDEPCFAKYDSRQIKFNKQTFGYNSMRGIKSNSQLAKWDIAAPLYQQAINFLYICSNKQIDIELKGSDTHEKRIRKIEQGCKDLWNLQNNKSK